MAETEKDDWLDDPIDSPGDQDVVASAQSDLDSTVLFDAQTASPSATESEPSSPDAELDQSSIDALFSQMDEPPSPSSQQVAAAETIDLGQSEIDDLLASPQKPAAEQAVMDPDQDEIDKLFSDMGTSEGESDNPFLEEESAVKEDSQPGQESSPQSANLDFGGDDFKFDGDIPDIPDTVSAPAAPETDFGSQAFGEETVVASPPAEPSARPAPVAEQGAKASGEAKKGGLVLALRQLVIHRKFLVGGAAGVALLLLTTTVFLLRGGHPQIAETTTSTTAAPAIKEEAPAAPTPQETEVHQPAPPAPTEPEPPKELAASPPSLPMNGSPTVESIELTMPPENSQMVITLRGSDPENEPLEYEFQAMPEHGQLSGHAPNLIYTPRPDFSGSDRFTVTATDGKNKSIPASITINRAAPVVVKEPPPVKEEVGLAEKKAPVFTTPKTRAKRVKPRAVAHGAEASAPGHHPVSVNRAPIIHLQPLAQRYATADTCVLNASQTSDEHRETVTFHWQQLAGEPVVLKPVSRDQAQVTFVVPASFSTVSDPTLQFLVTATDQEGATDAKEVTVVTQSRRHSALWQGRP